MTVRRIMGVETEYGISVPGRQDVSATMASAHVVTAYSRQMPGGNRQRVRWEFGDESPLRDARGFDMSRADADPSQLTDEDFGYANAVLPNGARLYVDHAHPEYSSPEVTNPLDAVLYDAAGEEIMRRSLAELESDSQTPTIRLYKNNSDSKGASYGTHENYLMRRETPFQVIAASLIPFFVCRPVITGAGRIGIGRAGELAGFQLSSRADYFEEEIGLETTMRRPIINTRDEPHADANEYRRLHVIVGDANMSQTAAYLKLGFTALVLHAIEAGVDFTDLALIEPVIEMHEVSYDTELTRTIGLKDGRSLTAIDLLEIYLERSAAAVTDQDEQTTDVVDRLGRVLSQLRTDKWVLANELDWIAKLRILEGYRRRDQLAWDAPALALVDLQYSDIDSHRGLANKLTAKGSLEQLFTPEQINLAVNEPPVDTRAWFRGKCVTQFADEVAAASWDAVVFDTPGNEALQRISTLDPFKGTQVHVQTLFDQAATADEFLALLERS